MDAGRSVDLSAWPGLTLVERIEDGHRNAVWRGDLDSSPVAVRWSRRSPSSLMWELDLLASLMQRDILVAEAIATRDGRRHDRGIVVHPWVEGRRPETDGDRRLVASALARAHDVVPEAGQRPGCCTVLELGVHRRSVDADLDALPLDVQQILTATFATFGDAPVGLIHGDPGPSNVRLDADDRVWLLDWDESRIDVLWHDLSELGVQVLADEEHRRAQHLSDAWEAVNAWRTEPNYARKRLAALRAAPRP